MKRRTFVAGSLAGLAGSVAGRPVTRPDEPPVREVLVMFKCHLDVGFVDTQAAIIDRYFRRYFPLAIETAHKLKAEGGDRYIWTTGSWLVYEYLEQARGAERARMEQALADGDLAWHALPFTWQSELLDESAVRGCVGFSKALDARFGKRTTGAKMTDVPGHTRGLVRPLRQAGVQFLDIGVNAASTAPDVPAVFTWRGSGGAALHVMYHRTGYGGVVRIPGSDVAVAVEVRDDNSGPHTLAEIARIYSKLRERFPGATVRAANLTEIGEAVQRFHKTYPAVTGEIGDTWIYGVASDPTKMAQYRELLRLRAAWVHEGKWQEGSEADLRFLGRFGLAAEHTWGTDTKTWLDFDHYRPEALGQVLSTPKYQTVAGSWVEKRQDIVEGVDRLPAVFQEQARERLKTLRPVRPSLEGWTPVEPSSVIETARFRLQIDPQSGAVLGLRGRDRKESLVGAQGPLALFSYQTLSQADYDAFLRSYITVQTDWAPKDFGKPNIGSFGAESRTWQAKSARVWQKPEAESHGVMVQLDLGEQEETSATAWPRDTFVRLTFPHREPRMDVELTWFGKRKNRMPEALWLSFHPQVRRPERWRLTKLGQPVNPREVVAGGNRHMHALTGPLAYEDGAERVSIDSLDAAVVSLGVQSPIYFSKEQPELTGGFHYSLFNNGWGTNYVQWFGDDARFRFRVELAS